MSLPRTARAPTRGAALLAAMITVALVATLAAAALWRQWRAVEVEAAERARVQSAWLLTGALDWGRLILGGDLLEDQRNQRSRRQPPADHLGEPWAVPLAEARLSTFLAAGETSAAAERDAFLSGEVTDLQSRLNLMNLIAGSKEQQTDALLRFDRLFTLLGLRSGELGALQRALANAHAAMQGQASETGDAPLMPNRFEQLAWLGVSPETLQALRPYATLLPLVNNAATTVNVNTASAEAIHAAAPSLDLAQAQRLVVQRDSGAFRTAEAIRQAAGLTSEADLGWLSVTSDFFEIRGRLRLDDVALEETALVQRIRQPRGVHTLWRERSACSPACQASPAPRP
ncbi:MAG: type II secretion system minor pseudopilin GspK [Pseudomonadota bacterium]|nr:type II secretion system minor pseudopilin GspK [Pseudomonadota bacterium]